MRIQKFLIGLAATSLLLSACGTTEHNPVSGEAIRADIRAELSSGVNLQEPVNGALTLEEAVARALKYNLNSRLSGLVEALSVQRIEVAEAAMLPKAVASINQSTRNNFDLSRSRNVKTGKVTGGDSYSDSKTSRNSSLTVSWNILDFGLSYVRAKQAKDRALIAAERRRKVIHDLVNEVQANYWRAYSAQQMDARVKALGLKAMEARQSLEAVVESRLNPPVDVLRDLREILDLELQLKSISRELVENKTRLAALMGMMPNARFKLQPADSTLADMRVDYKKLEDYALQHRPELREDEYNLRISRNEVTAAMLSMLPGVSLTAALNSTNDSLSVNEDWITGSLSVGYNLFNLVSAPEKIRLANVEQDIVKQRKLVVGSAVLLSVRLAWIDYWESLKNYRALHEIQDVEDELLERVRAQADANNIGEVELIRADIGSLVNRLRYNFAFADVKSAQNRILVSIAYDASPVVDENTDLEELTKTVSAMLESWQDNVNNLHQTVASNVPHLKAVLPTQG